MSPRGELLIEIAKYIEGKTGEELIDMVEDLLMPFYADDLKKAANSLFSGKERRIKLGIYRGE